MKDYENIIRIKETYSAKTADALLEEGWILLCVSKPSPNEEHYALGWDKRKGAIPEPPAPAPLTEEQKKFFEVWK